MHYNELNKILNSIFFDGRFKQIPVFLDLEDNIKVELSKKVDLLKSDFDHQLGQIVKSKLSDNSNDPYSKIDLDTREWSQFGRSRLPPPFTSLLCLLSLAAEKMTSEDGKSQTNYYVRLNDLLGINENDSLARSIKNNSRLTEKFWLQLNKWLVKNDFDFGIPTAKAFFPNWKYVSYAWSQALIRDADRQNLDTFFLARNFYPKQSISEMEMKLHLNEWMMPNKASSNLLRIWNDENSKDKVVDASIEYLQEWKGSGKIGEFDTNMKRELLMICSISDFPRKLNLEMVSFGIPNIEDYKFILDEEDINYQNEFLEIYKNDIKDFSFKNFMGHEFSILTNIKDIFNYLLQTKFFLKTNEADVKLAFNPKPYRIFMKDDNSSFFREIPRVLFFKTQMILCASGWSKKVEGHLSKSARPGYKKFKHSELNGLPDSWDLFTDVEILSKFETSDNNLDALVPYSDGLMIELSGGLKLNQSFYHSLFPPVLKVSSDQDRVHIAYGEEQFSEKENINLVSKYIIGFHEEPIEKSFSIQFSNLKITLSQDRKKTREKVIHFRNADEPKVINVSKNQSYYIPSNRDLGWALSTNRIHDNESCSIDGMKIRGNFLNDKVYEATKTSLTSMELDEEYSEVKQVLTNKYSNLKAVTETCILRGHHIWIYPSYNQFQKQKKIDIQEGKCKDCEIQYFKIINKKKKLLPKLEDKSPLSISKPQIEIEKIDIDYGLFDALCYMGEGNWISFSNLTTHFNDELFFPKNFLRDLIHLGHIDVEYDKNCQPLSWKVNPPSLVQINDNSYFFAGFRNQDMIQKLKDLCKRLNCEFVFKNNKDCVSSYFINKVSKEDILSHFCNIKDPNNRAIELIENYSSDLTKILPSILDTLTFSNPIHIANPDKLESFSVEKGKWVTSGNLDAIGSYRFRLYGQKYFIKTADGILRETFHEIAKIYSCILKGVRLHTYDENNKEFLCFLGNQPPVLFGRALVSSSGLLPEKRENLLIYKNIEPSIGNMLINKLYYQG